MTPRRLFILTFIESFATICIERAIFFYTEEMLGFTKAANLWLALVFGICYIVGAFACHSLCVRAGEKPILLLTIVGQLVCHLALLATSEMVGVLFVLYAALGLLNGAKWPVVESYVSAGHGPREQARVVGRFNIAWASAVPLSLAGSGLLIGFWPPGLFLLPAAINAVSLLLIRPLAGRPTHLPGDHPERPDATVLARYGRLLAAARWLLVLGYATLWVLAAVMPHVFKRLGVGVSAASALSGCLDVMRVAAFAVLGAWTAWHYRRWPLAAVIVAMPVGFFLVLWANSVPMALVGEGIFGLAIGQAYYASLYYGLLVRNAAVDAGGAHEGLIGTGFALGPIVGLVGLGLQQAGFGEVRSMVIGIGPLIAGFAIAATIALARSGRSVPIQPK